MDETQLELSRLKIRVMLLEHFFFQICLMLPPARDFPDIEANQKHLHSLLERQAKMAEAVYLRFAKSSTEGAMMADESREIVEQLKKQIDELAAQLSPNFPKK